MGKSKPYTGPRKRCPKCGHNKPATTRFFSPVQSRQGRTGLQSWCRTCCTNYKKLKYRINPVDSKAYSKACQETYRLKHPERILYNGAKGRAKKHNHIFKLKIEDIIIPKVCPYFGIPLVVELNRSGPVDNAPTIDRIDATKGYTKDNIEVISWRANIIKSFGTAEEHEKIAARMRQLEVSNRKPPIPSRVRGKLS